MSQLNAWCETLIIFADHHLQWSYFKLTVCHKSTTRWPTPHQLPGVFLPCVHGYAADAAHILFANKLAEYNTATWTSVSFLALLECVSGAIVVARGTVVRKTRFQSEIVKRSNTKFWKGRTVNKWFSFSLTLQIFLEFVSAYLEICCLFYFWNLNSTKMLKFKIS